MKLKLTPFLPFALTLMLLIFISENNHAAIISISSPTFFCKTQNAEYQFYVTDKDLELVKENQNERNVASIHKSTKAIHEITHQSWNKKFYLGGHQAKLHIKNFKNPTDLDDYFSLQSPKGHKMTYGLVCLSLKK